jgi:hypothetical protein
MTSAATELRLKLAALGITPLPSTITKEVFLPEWTTRVIDRKEILSWDGRHDWPNTSCKTSSHPCADIDILAEEVADAAEQLVRTRFEGRGTMLVRISRAPKRLIPFCTDVPFDKRLLCYVAPNGTPHKVEFLGRGQQAVFYGMHESGKPYHWHADRDPLKVPPKEWVKITEAEAEELLTEIHELLTEQFGYARAAPPNGAGRSGVHVTDVDAAFAALRYAGHGGGGNVHDTELGCINALLVQDASAEFAIEEVLAAVRIYAVTNQLCASWNWDKERRHLEEMAYSFINKFPEYADRLPPDLYAARQIRRGQGVLDPVLVYDRARKLWHYPEPEEDAAQDTDGDTKRKVEGNGKATPGKSKFQLIPFDQLRPGNDPGYLVDDLIPLRGIVLIWGKRKCLKSFWTYDLCFHIAHCTEYRERAIHSGGPVVYCAFEGAHGYKKRAEALRRYHKIPVDIVVPLYLVAARINMVKEHPLLIAAIREQLMGELPRVIVLDTLNKSLVGSESKDVDMAAYIVAAEALRGAFDCVVIIVHHCGYDETHPRGHTSLTGAVDAEFEVVREGMLVTVKNVTMRDGAEEFEIRSAAQIIDVGTDIHGKDLTSLVIVPTDAPAVSSRSGRRSSLDSPTIVPGRPLVRPAPESLFG